MADIKIREMTEASLTDVSNDSIIETSIENSQASSGFVTRKIKLSTLASYVLNKFSTLSLGGTVRTVKSAIDDVVSLMGNLTNLTTEDKTSLVAAINEAAQSGGGGGSSPSPYTSNPASLGTASAGSSSNYSRGDHVHPMPTAADIGALPDSTTIPSAATATPSNLGTAAVGSSSKYAKEDHVHNMPSASDVGAIASPSSPSSGQFLVYNGSAWVAQSLSTWQGGNY